MGRGGSHRASSEAGKKPGRRIGSERLDDDETTRTESRGNSIRRGKKRKRTEGVSKTNKKGGTRIEEMRRKRIRRSEKELCCEALSRSSRVGEG